MVKPQGKVVHHGYKPVPQRILEVTEHSVAAWCPDKNALQPPTQVHFSMTVKDYRFPFVIRFKSPDTLGHLIETLASYRRYVWPDSEPLELDKPLQKGDA